MARKRNVTDYRYLKLLLYGQAGSTKTRTAGTAELDERTSPVLWLDNGGNPVSLRTYSKVPDIIEISKLKDYNPIYAWLANGQDKDHEIVRMFDLHPPYKTLVVDGLTGTQRMSFNVVTNATDLGPADFPAKFEWEHYNKVLGQMMNFGMYFFMRLDMHVIMTALERRDENINTGNITIKPLLLGQSAEELPGQALAVGRMIHVAKVDPKTRQDITRADKRGIPEDTVSILVFKPGRDYVAKDQYLVFPPYMEDPTISKLMDLIEEGGHSLVQ